MAKKRRSWKTTKWKVVLCSVGEDCWCRVIEAETGTLLIGAGEIGKRTAEFIVKEHNELLEMRNL